MGGSCYKDDTRELLVVGNYCENNCFPKNGGCASVITDKVDTRCELRPETEERVIPNVLQTVNNFVEAATNRARSAFLYTPDMFNSFYFDAVLSQLPSRNGNTYIAINGCVRTFIDKTKGGWQSLYSKGVREVWLGVESGSSHIRSIYNKPAFSNEEIVNATIEGRNRGINICWFLVDGPYDTDETRLQTYYILREAQPFRFHISIADQVEAPKGN